MGAAPTTIRILLLVVVTAEVDILNQAPDHLLGISPADLRARSLLPQGLAAAAPWAGGRPNTAVLWTVSHLAGDLVITGVFDMAQVVAATAGRPAAAAGGLSSAIGGLAATETVGGVEGVSAAEAGTAAGRKWLLADRRFGAVGPVGATEGFATPEVSVVLDGLAATGRFVAAGGPSVSEGSEVAGVIGASGVLTIAERLAMRGGRSKGGRFAVGRWFTMEDGSSMTGRSSVVERLGLPA